MKKKLIIIGAGGHGKVAADIALAMDVYDEVAFLDDNQEGTILGLPVIGKTDDIYKYSEDAEFFVAIGNNRIRKELLNRLDQMSVEIATLIHPAAVVSKFAVIGSGTVIMPGAVVNAEAKLGKGVIINTGATVDHECEIDDCVHISVGANIAGRVHVGEDTMIGVGAAVINNIDIREDCMIGAGAVVVKNIVERGAYIGVPARRC